MTTNPLKEAVLHDNFTEVKALIESGISVNTKNSLGHTPLIVAICKRREAIFDYLLSLEGVDIEVKVLLQRTPLLLTAGNGALARFARKLISKGADIHARDCNGFTYLHLATSCSERDTLEVGKTVIEMGADVNARSSHGITPLYAACSSGNFGWALMLLYYGADATIPSAEGVLPLAVVPSCEKELELREILFNYTFDGLNNTIRLATLAQAMTLDSTLFLTIVNSHLEVVYDAIDLHYLYIKLPYVKSNYFRIFMEKNGHIVKKMIKKYHPILDILGHRLPFLPQIFKLKDLLYVFLESDFVDLFVQTDVPFCAVSKLMQKSNNCEIVITEEEVEEIVLLMVSHGLKVVSEDMDMIYKYYGCNELFKILLHTDIEIIHNGELSMAALYYDVNIILEPKICIYDPALLSYFNDAPLKERCLEDPSCTASFKEMVKKLPLVPSLIELSRNMARKYIINRFNIKNSMQFYTTVKWLPIGDITKLIITLDKELY